MAIFKSYKNNGYYLEDNTQGQHTGFAIMISPNRIYEIAKNLILPNSPEKDVTLIMLPTGYVIKKTVFSVLGEEHTTKTYITDFAVKGDCAKEVSKAMEELKEAIYGQNYIQAKNRHLKNNDAEQA